MSKRSFHIAVKVHFGSRLNETMKSLSERERILQKDSV